MKNKGVQALLLAVMMGSLSLTACGDKNKVVDGKEATETQKGALLEAGAGESVKDTSWIGDEESLAPTKQSDDGIIAEVVDVVME